MLDEPWTNAEKRIARVVFESARVAELNGLLLQFKQRAAHATDIDEVWRIRDWLNSRQRDIENNFDFRYSQLLRVFGYLVATGRVEIEALKGLSETKIETIKRIAEFRAS